MARLASSRVARSTGLTEYRSMTRASMPSCGQFVGRGQALVQGHAGADQGDLVVRAGPMDLGPADVELLVAR